MVFADSGVLYGFKAKFAGKLLDLVWGTGAR